MSGLETFSRDYESARRNFRDAAGAAGARLLSYELDATGRNGESLTIDVAIIGAADPRRVLMVSSGIHGVEGFFGSAVQTGWLASQPDGAPVPKDTAVILLHALNPYGFSWLRRVNEDNIDLNRNFLCPHEKYRGSPPGYAELNAFLNPSSAPLFVDMFRLKMLWHIARRGMPAMKSAIAVGQYDHPQGLFFGGRAPAQSTRIIQANCAHWVGAASDIVHVDLHTGLGESGSYKLLVLDAPDSPQMTWYRDRFGSDNVESTASSADTAYPARGMIGGWLAEHLADRRYRYMAAEFGTYPVVRVLAAMRAENLAHLHGTPGSGAHERAKTRMLECFCPRSASWRERVLRDGLGIMRAALDSLAG